MRIRYFTPLQPIPDILITPQELELDPEVSLKHEDLYARTWECEYEKPIFDAENDNVTPPKSPENAVQFFSLTEETWSSSRTAQECSRENFPQTEDLCDVTDTYPDLEPDAKTSSEALKNSPTNPRSSKYNSHPNPRINCNNNYRFEFLCYTSMFHGTRT